MSAAARRYANALLELALEQGIASEVRDDLGAAREILDGHTELTQALDHPALAADKRRGLARAQYLCACGLAVIGDGALSAIGLTRYAFTFRRVRQTFRGTLAGLNAGQ